MLTLHLARHGDTTQSSEGVFCGELDPPLTDKGKLQAEKLARVTATLDLEAIYISPKLRARQTAEATLAATKLEPNIREGLREIGYGTWEGRHEKEIKASERDAYDAWVADPALVSPPGGQNAFAIAARAPDPPRGSPSPPERARPVRESQGDGPRPRMCHHRSTARALSRPRRVPDGVAHDDRVRRPRPDADPDRRHRAPEVAVATAPRPACGSGR